jgi:hypothetical protein
MSERFPDEPMLPLFPERTVFYHVIRPHGPNGEYPERGWDTVHLPVDEIDQVQDPNLRDALHRKFLGEERNPRNAHMVFVNPDGTYNHTETVSTKQITLPPLGEGVQELGD